MILKKKSQLVILKKRWNHFIDKLEKIVLECPTLEKNKGELCLEIFCNFYFIFRHINLDGLNKISVSK